jgi:hypothetical protein
MLTPSGALDFRRAFNPIFLAKEQILLFNSCKQAYGDEIQSAMLQRYTRWAQELTESGVLPQQTTTEAVCTVAADREYGDLERICHNSSIMCLYSAVDGINKTAVHIVCQEDRGAVRDVIAFEKPKLSLPASDDSLLQFVDETNVGYETRFRILERMLPLRIERSIPFRANDDNAIWVYDPVRFRRLGDERRSIVHEDLMRGPSIDVLSYAMYAGDYLQVVNECLESMFHRGDPSVIVPRS